MKQDISIRAAVPEDAGRLLAIYAPYVEKTAITFEYQVPSVDEFRGRIENTLKRYPYLVAQEKGEILGYAYAGVFKDRAAYDWSVETTIYVDMGSRHSGVGGALYSALEGALKSMNILNLNACIGVPRSEDPHLDMNSVHFHEHMGYTLVGTFHCSGYKFGTWYDMVWMEKMLDRHTIPAEPVHPWNGSI